MTCFVEIENAFKISNDCRPSNHGQLCCTAIGVQYIAFFGSVSIRVFAPESILWTVTYFVSVLCEFTAMSIATMWVSSKVKSIIQSQSYHIRKFESKSRNEYVSIDSRKYEHESIHNDPSIQTTSILLHKQGRHRRVAPGGVPSRDVSAVFRGEETAKIQLFIDSFCVFPLF